MTFEFPRIEAGRYSVLQNKKMVGYIEKKSSAKWIAYVCENVAVKGKPRSVNKTLKECKEVFPTLVSPVEVNEQSPELETLIASVQENDKMQLMREFMEKGNVELHQYELHENKMKEVKPFSDFLKEEDLVNL